MLEIKNHYVVYIKNKCYSINGRIDFLSYNSVFSLIGLIRQSKQSYFTELTIYFHDLKEGNYKMFSEEEFLKSEMNYVKTIQE